MEDLIGKFDDEQDSLIEDYEKWVSEEYESIHGHKEELPTKENTPTYEIVYASKLKEGETPLSRVVGHENQKKELLSVIE
jgi:hypothetical protein